MNGERNRTGARRIAHLRGNLINDNSNDCDSLGYHVYAETLATSLHNATTPITVGIFGSWGIGKSFVAKRVQDLLSKMERRENISEEKCSSHNKRLKGAMEVLLSIFVFCILIATMVIIIFDMSTNHTFNPLQQTNSSNTTKTTPRLMEVLSWTLLSLSGLILVITSVLVLSNSSSKGSRKFKSYWILLLYIMFTKIPLKRTSSPDQNITGRKHETTYKETDDEDGNNETRSNLTTKYIFVDFNAWQYVGSDMLWAGIILNIVQAVEKEIGVVCVRLFRMLQSENDCLDDESSDAAPSSGFYLHLGSECIRRQIDESYLKQFGVVKNLVKEENRWFIKYDDPIDESTAFHTLQISGFKVSNFDDDPIDESTTFHNLQNSECKVSNVVETYRMCYETSIFHVEDHGNHATKSGNHATKCAKQQQHQQLIENNVEEVQVVDGSMAVKVPRCKNRGNEDGFYKYMRANPRRVWCGCQYLCCFVFFVLSFIVSLTGAIAMMAISFGRNLKAQDEGDLSPGKTVIAVLPPALLGAYVVLWFGWSMFNSQIRRISVALDGAKGSITSGLGLMNIIKEEVAILSKLINVIRFTHKIEYKIVITVDDLDRCPLKMVRKVLEAVSVLLSDDSSPFVCLIVANPRVVSKCIEGGMEEALIKANITGHEYIKKIINLPFCIPSVSSLKRFCEGAHDTADGNRIEPEDDVDNVMDSGDETPSIASRDFLPRVQLTRKGNRITFKDFKIKCRQLLEGKVNESECIHTYLISNPRNVKRIMNVLMITIRLLETIRERAEFINFLLSEPVDDGRPDSVLEFGEWDNDATDLVKWIILTDQWPFLMSCLLHHMQEVQVYKEGYRRAEADTYSLLELYEDPENKLEVCRKSCTLSSLDQNPKLLKCFLEECQSLTVARVKTLLRFTVNLDPSLKQELSSHFD